MPDAHLFAADVGNDLIAFTILAGAGATEAEFRIALRPDKTGLGLGKGITVRTLEIGFEQLGFARIHLVVRKNNIRGIRLYQRIGFTDQGECRKEIQGKLVDFWRMEIGQEEFSRLPAGTL